MKKLYREIFLKSKKEIDKKLSSLETDEVQNYLEHRLKEQIFASEREIREEFEKVECKNCGKCCRFAISEFPPEELTKRAKNGDKTAANFIKTFTLYKKEEIPPEFLSQVKAGANCYRCTKVEKRGEKYFCPNYSSRPDICKTFPDTPLEPLPEGCAYLEWKLNNETKALFIKALNDIRKFYIKNPPER